MPISSASSKCFDKGDLLRGIAICSGAAFKAVRQLLTATFSNNSSLFELLNLFNFYKRCWPYMVYHSESFLWKHFYVQKPAI
jgi:hypothetical protein